MKVLVRGGFSFPTKDDLWIKADIEIELNEKEIAKPKTLRVNETIDKGIKLIVGRIEHHLSKQVEDVKKLGNKSRGI